MEFLRDAMPEPRIILDTLTGETVEPVLNELSHLYLATREKYFLEDLVAFQRRYLPLRHASIIEFKKELQPRSLHAEGTGFDEDLHKYMSGLYLLDPYFAMYENRNKTGTFYLDLDNWDDTETSKHFKLYWRRVIGNGELAGLYEIAPGRCIHKPLRFNPAT